MALKETDISWFSRLKRKDEKAFDQFFQTYRKAIFLAAYDLLKDEMEAEDVMLQTFLKAWQQIASIDDPAHLKNWLFMVSRRLAIDVLRKSKREKIVCLDEVDIDNKQDIVSHPEIVYAEVLSAVHDSIETLPGRMQEAVKLRYLEEMPAPEVAKIMGVSIETVHNLTYRAVRKLRFTFLAQESTMTVLLFLFVWTI